MKMEQEVKAWIEERFTLDDVTLEPFPIFPAGTLIKDREGGQMVVFYDILYGRVDYRFPDPSTEVGQAMEIYQNIKERKD